MFPVEACHQRYTKGRPPTTIRTPGAPRGGRAIHRRSVAIQDALLAAEGPPVDPNNTSWRLEPPLPRGTKVAQKDIIPHRGELQGLKSPGALHSCRLYKDSAPPLVSCQKIIRALHHTVLYTGENSIYTYMSCSPHMCRSNDITRCRLFYCFGFL